MNLRRKVLKTFVLSMIGQHAYAQSGHFEDGKPDKTATLQKTGYADSGFADLMHQFYPGLLHNSYFKATAPFSYIFRNLAKEDVYGYSLKWAVSAHGEVIESFKRVFVKRPSLIFRKRQQTMQSPYLRPGEYALVTPFFIITASEFKAYKSKKELERMLQRFEPTQQAENFSIAVGAIHRYKHDMTVKVYVKAAIYADRVLGSDAPMTSRIVRNFINAEHDEAESLMNACMAADQQIDETRLREKIRESLAIGSRSLAKGRSDYVESRNEFARKILYVLEAEGASRLPELLSLHSQRRKSVLS